MSKPNPEAEAQKTVQSFRECAETHKNISQVWAEMAQDSKAFGHGSAADKAYFHSVTEGLKKQGLLPELTVAYAKWTKNEMQNDDGDLGKYRIDDWRERRESRNGRVCEVEQALLNNLKKNFDSMRETGHNALGEWGHKGLTDGDLQEVNAKYSQARHKNERDAANVATVARDASAITHGMFDARKADGSVLFDKLSQANGGKYITRESIDQALSFDVDQRNRMHGFMPKGTKSYLDYQDRVVIQKLENQYWDNISHNDRVTKDDLNRYLASHSGDKK